MLIIKADNHIIFSYAVFAFTYFLTESYIVFKNTLSYFKLTKMIPRLFPPSKIHRTFDAKRSSFITTFAELRTVSGII